MTYWAIPIFTPFPLQQPDVHQVTHNIQQQRQQKPFSIKEGWLHGSNDIYPTVNHAKEKSYKSKSFLYLAYNHVIRPSISGY